MSKRRYLGSWTLPSGNSCDVYFAEDVKPGTVRADALCCEWDVPPSPSWPPEDLVHYHAVTFPAILRAVADVTGQRVVGVV
jgi:hypothetical protein